MALYSYWMAAVLLDVGGFFGVVFSVAWAARVRAQNLSSMILCGLGLFHVFSGHLNDLIYTKCPEVRWLISVFDFA